MTAQYLSQTVGLQPKVSHKVSLRRSTTCGSLSLVSISHSISHHTSFDCFTNIAMSWSWAPGFEDPRAEQSFAHSARRHTRRQDFLVGLLAAALWVMTTVRYRHYVLASGSSVVCVAAQGAALALAPPALLLALGPRCYSKHRLLTMSGEVPRRQALIPALLSSPPTPPARLWASRPPARRARFPVHVRATCLMPRPAAAALQMNCDCLLLTHRLLLLQSCGSRFCLCRASPPWSSR